MANNYVYILDGKAYVNLTNRCHNACTFCIRNTGDGVVDTPLWLDSEPTEDDVFRNFDSIKKDIKSDEVVFCGFGEPTEALDVLVSCARRFKALGYRTRLNTNGLGSAVAGRDITAELEGVLDTVSISLNECDAKKYAFVTRSAFGIDAFSHVLDFARACVSRNINTVFTVVDTISDDDIDSCRDLSAALGIPLRVRGYVSDNYKDREGK